MIYDKPSDAMMADARRLFEAALFAPSQFDLMLMRACDADFITFDAAITLAHAALS